MLESTLQNYTILFPYSVSCILTHLHGFFAVLALGDFTDDIGFFIQAGEPDKNVVSLLFRDSQHHADAAVEGAVHLGLFNVAGILQDVEDRQNRP